MLCTYTASLCLGTTGGMQREEGAQTLLLSALRVMKGS